MKKIQNLLLTTMLTLAVVSGLVACGNGGNEPDYDYEPPSVGIERPMPELIDDEDEDYYDEDDHYNMYDDYDPYDEDGQYDDEIIDEEPEPIEVTTLNGSGATITEPFFLAAGQHIVNLSHVGNRNFIVRLYDDEFERVRGISGLANQIGDYDGQVLIDVPTAGYFILDVSADGEWDIDFDPNIPTTAPDITEGFSGTGTTLLFVSAESQQNLVMELTHNGSRNFIVRFNDRGLVNQIGSGTFEEIVRVPRAGIFVFEIRADGDWTINPRD